jgi:hypothetical protein
MAISQRLAVLTKISLSAASIKPRAAALSLSGAEIAHQKV